VCGLTQVTDYINRLDAIVGYRLMTLVLLMNFFHHSFRLYT